MSIYIHLSTVKFIREGAMKRIMAGFLSPAMIEGLALVL